MNLLQEKPEIQELQLNLDGVHEGDCNISLEKHSQQVRETRAIYFLTECVV